MILKKVKEYYDLNNLKINSFLETSCFLVVNEKYPNSVVIKFGKSKIAGEVSVWDFEESKYLELELVNFVKPENEPVFLVMDVDESNVISQLDIQFNRLFEMSIRDNSLE
jgi:hypothetical protein